MCSSDLYANAANKIGAIDFPALTTADATASTAASSYAVDLRLPFTCAEASRTLYGILVTVGAFTPDSQQQFTVSLAAQAT